MLGPDPPAAPKNLDQHVQDARWGKEYVRTMGVFLTNDAAAIRARGRLLIIAAGVQYTSTPLRQLEP